MKMPRCPKSEIGTTEHEPAEPLELSRPHSAFLEECRRRYTVQQTRTAQAEAERDEQWRENRRRIQILRAFK